MIASAVVAVLAFAGGFWCGRHPITSWPTVQFWIRRRAAMRRHYENDKP